MDNEEERREKQRKFKNTKARHNYHEKKEMISRHKKIREHLNTLEQEKFIKLNLEQDETKKEKLINEYNIFVFHNANNYEEYI